MIFGLLFFSSQSSIFIENDDDDDDDGILLDIVLTNSEPSTNASHKITPLISSKSVINSKEKLI